MHILSNKKYKDLINRLERASRFHAAFLRLTKQGEYVPISPMLRPLVSEDSPIIWGVDEDITLEEVIERHKQTERESYGK